MSEGGGEEAGLLPSGFPQRTLRELALPLPVPLASELALPPVAPEVALPEPLPVAPELALPERSIEPVLPEVPLFVGLLVELPIEPLPELLIAPDLLSEDELDELGLDELERDVFAFRLLLRFVFVLVFALTL